jgi:hypothetical protein
MPAAALLRVINAVTLDCKLAAGAVQISMFVTHPAFAPFAVVITVELRFVHVSPAVAMLETAGVTPDTFPVAAIPSIKRSFVFVVVIPVTESVVAPAEPLVAETPAPSSESPAAAAAGPNDTKICCPRPTVIRSARRQK